MEIKPLFAMPLAVEQIPEHEALCAELAPLFLDKEAAGDRWRNETRRETQKGALFESRFDLFAVSYTHLRAHET